MTETHELKLKFTGDSVELVGHAKKTDEAIDGVGNSAKGSSDAMKDYSKSSDKASKSNKKTEKSSNSLMSGFKKLAPVVLSVAAIFSSISEVTSVEKKFQTIEASLVTVTGSYKTAETAMVRIEELTKRTPFQLEEVSGSFIKLANLGLKPSERAIVSYGNTAAAMGKQLDQMIEAVADASVGEFERLKEFGIKARVEGDKVKLTFKGVTTEIGNNSNDIQNYLLAIGETDFAGGMDRQMETIGGAISNFDDQWDSTIKTISEETGLGQAIQDSIRIGITALEELQAGIGPVMDEINALSMAWGSTFSDNIGRAGDSISEFTAQYDSEIDYLAQSSLTTGQFLTKTFKELPQNLIAAIKIMTIEIATFISSSTDWASESWNTLQGVWATIIGDDAEVERLINARLDMMSRFEVAAQAREQVRLDSIESILLERDATTQAYEIELAQLQRLREERQAARGQGGSLSDLVSTEEPVEAGMSNKDQATLQKLEESFMTEKELLLLQYDERQKIITDFLDRKQISEDKHNELSLRNHTEYTDAVARIDEQAAAGRSAMLGSMFGAIGSLMDGENKKSFERQKKFSIAQQLVELPHSIQQSYENGGGYPWGLIPAGIMLAKGMSLIRKTQSQSFSGGGSISIGGGASSIPAASSASFASTPRDTQNANSQQSNINNPQDAANLQGGVNKVEYVVNNYIENVNGTGQQVFEEFRGFMKDGQTLFDNSSRQQQVINESVSRTA